VLDVKNSAAYTSAPPYVFVVWCLSKHRDSFTCYSTGFSEYGNLPLVLTKARQFADWLMDCKIVKLGFVPESIKTAACREVGLR
jgi:hypothetical protein